jgi:hypothetical protein
MLAVNPSGAGTPFSTMKVLAMPLEVMVLSGCSTPLERQAAGSAWDACWPSRPAALPGDQGLRTPLRVGLGQSEHLTPTKAHQRRGSRYFDPAHSQILQHAHPVDLRPALRRANLALQPERARQLPIRFNRFLSGSFSAASAI